MSVHPWESTGRTRGAAAPPPSSWWRCLALWVLATTGTATRASAQTRADAPGATVTGTIIGTVREANGTPVRDATILLVDVPREPVTTDGFGRYVLRAVPAGTRRLFVSASGLAPARRAVTVPAGDTAHVDIALQRGVLELAGVTVSATATGRDPLAVTQPVTTLGPRELERSLGATLTQTLSWTAGVTARSQGPAATMPVIRGLTGERIVVLHDGQRAGDLAASAPDHGVTIDPLSAREVEIVRGPAALLHGSAALGGVVNVLSDDIARTVPAGRLSSLTVNAQSASEGGGALLDVSQPFGPSTVLRLKAGGRSHGNQALGVGGGRDVLDNTSMRNRQGVVSLTHVRDEALAGVALRRYDFEYGLPWRTAAADGVRLRGARDEVSVRAERAGRGGFTRLRLDASAQSYAHDERTAAGEVATALAVRSQQGQLLARTRAAGPLRDGAVGVSFLARRNAVTGAQALTPPNANRALALFAFQELAPLAGRFGLRMPLALRVERVSSESDVTTQFGAAVARRFTTVSASGGVSVPLSRDASIAVNVARATRVPSPEELFSRAGHAGTGAFEIGNPSLDVEVTRGVDAVVRVERRALRAQVALFSSAVHGWIGLYPSGRDTVIASPGGATKALPLFTSSQREARLRGAEASVEGTLTRRVVATLTADLLRASDDRGGALPYMPPARVGGGARWDDGRWQFGTAVRRVLAQRRVTNGEIPTDPFTVVEGHAGVRLVVGAQVHTLMLRGENLGDRFYRDATSRIKDFAPAAGRNVSLLYRVTF